MPSANLWGPWTNTAPTVLRIFVSKKLKAFGPGWAQEETLGAGKGWQADGACVNHGPYLWDVARISLLSHPLGR